MNERDEWDESWFRIFAREHDRLAAFVRANLPDEPDCGKPTRRESVFDDVIRLLSGLRTSGTGKGE